MEHLVAEHNAQLMQNETQYTDFCTLVQRALQKSLAYKAALLTYELKLKNATEEFQKELEKIEQNFKNT